MVVSGDYIYEAERGGGGGLLLSPYSRLANVGNFVRRSTFRKTTSSWANKDLLLVRPAILKRIRSYREKRENSVDDFRRLDLAGWEVVVFLLVRSGKWSRS